MTTQATQTAEDPSLTALTTRPNGVIGVNMRELRDVADLIFQSKVYGDIQTKEAAAIKVIAGMEYGFSPFQSMSMFDFIQGRPTLNAHGKATLINSSGDFRLKINELTPTNCSISVARKSDGGEWKIIFTSTFSWQDAQDAELTNGKNAHSWKKYPRNMLFARCVSNIWRWATAELNLRKLGPGQVVEEFTADELTAELEPGPQTAVVVDGEVVEETGAATEAVDMATGEVIEAEPVNEQAEPVTDRDESAKADLIAAIEERMTEKIGGMPSDRKKFLKGRVLENESIDALKGMLAELDAM